MSQPDRTSSTARGSSVRRSLDWLVIVAWAGVLGLAAAAIAGAVLLAEWIA